MLACANTLVNIRQGSKAPQRQETIIATGIQAQIAMDLVQTRGMPLIGRDIAQHHIGMAADIFGGGLDGEIHAMLERLK